MSDTYTVIGHPGTGKTTYLAAQIDRAVRNRGSESVIVSSFTRAASVEILSRIKNDNIALPKDRVGTLHSHAFRALGTPDIADLHVDLWNADNPLLSLSGGIKPEDVLDQGYGKTEGDELYGEYNLLRNKLVDREVWPARVVNFAKRWEKWKKEKDLRDFTDLIEDCLNGGVKPIGEPSIGFFDECQDFTQLEMTLVDKWSEYMSTVVLAGDANQVLYSFKGASPLPLLEKIKDQSKLRVLPRSYRVPKLVQEYSRKWILRAENRIDPVYEPRDVDGFVRSSGISMRWPSDILTDMKRYEGKSIMLMTSCSFMLDGLKKELREKGVLFYNPYRRSRGDWNPLQVSRGISSVDRLMAFLRPSSDVFGDDARPWTWKDVYDWTSVLKAKGVILHGQKKTIEASKNVDKIKLDEYDMMSIFEPSVLTEIYKLDLDWFRRNLADSHRAKFDYIFKVIGKGNNIETLKQAPKIMIGTIHSFKGGEADIVYVFPDMSYQGMMSWYSGGEDRDSIYRLFYVAFTRAKEGVVLCESSSNSSIDFPGT